MFPAGNRVKRLSSVNHTTKTIHHYHHHHNHHHHHHQKLIYKIGAAHDTFLEKAIFLAHKLLRK